MDGWMDERNKVLQFIYFKGGPPEFIGSALRLAGSGSSLVLSLSTLEQCLHITDLVWWGLMSCPSFTGDNKELVEAAFPAQVHIDVTAASPDRC